MRQTSQAELFDHMQQSLSEARLLQVLRAMIATILALSSRKEADMGRYASSEILDCMHAYYKVTVPAMAYHP